MFCSVVERHTRLLCSTLERAKRTSAPSCLTAQAARPMKTLCLDWDGRCSHPHPQINTPSIHRYSINMHTQMYRHTQLYMYPSGGPGHTLWLYGWPPEEWQHRSNSSLLCYLHRGSHLPRLHSYAIWFWWLPHQKGKKSCLLFCCDQFWQFLPVSDIWIIVTWIVLIAHNVSRKREKKIFFACLMQWNGYTVLPDHSSMLL